jgi:pSer/pThr/pTyr-binding forkhead associated (FHA) protein
LHTDFNGTSRSKSPCQSEKPPSTTNPGRPSGRPTHRIDRAETVLGREEADLQIEDDEISKRHCLIRADGPVCTLTDLGSLNGTMLNGRPMREGVAQRLRHLDEIQLGTTRLFLLAGKFRSHPM